MMERMDALGDGGGGWSLNCKKEGVFSSVTNDTTWTFRCRSHHAFKCPGQLKLVLRTATSEFHLQNATGWLHKHEGELMSTTGLPPTIKLIVDGIVHLEPTIKFRALCNRLYEVHNVDKALEARIENYFYRSCAERKLAHAQDVGRSSFGAMQTWVDGNDLFDRLAAHKPTNDGDKYINVAGVIGFHIDPETKRCAVMISTPKLLLDAWVFTKLGYTDGQLHVDHTFKLFFEQIPMLVTSVADIRQHVHPTGFGPTTHMDKEMTTECLKWVKDTTDTLLRMLFNNSHNAAEDPWPENFSDELIAELNECYADYIQAWGEEHLDDGAHDGTKIEYMPWALMGDAAAALGNAGVEVFDAHVRMCWVHVWRAVMNNISKLRDQSEQRKNLLYTDLSFIHNVSCEELLPKEWYRFERKWRIDLCEPEMTAYIMAEWRNKNWTRADAPAGDPSDNNTLESLNRVLKADHNFTKASAVAVVMPHALTVMMRFSRDAKPIALAPAVPKKEWVKAQKLASSNYFSLAYKMGDAFVVPSEKLLSTLPGTTTGEQRTNMSVWIREYASMMKNPSGYHKIANSPTAWSFDILNDYLFSFWKLEKIPTSHPSCTELAKAGIIYSCNCPQFMHYHYCKHAIGFGMFNDNVTAPAAASTVTLGKRKAPAGARLLTRGHCLAIED